MSSGDAFGIENAWTISSPIAGTIVTANYAIGTASGNTLCGVLVPKGSPKSALIRRAVLVVVSGTMVTANAFVWGVMSSANAATVTSTGTEPTNMWTFATATGAHVARYYAGDGTSSVLAGTTAAAVAMLRPFGGGGQGAVVTGSPYTIVEDVAEDLNVAPGCFCGLFPTVGAAALTVAVALTVSEGS